MMADGRTGFDYVGLTQSLLRVMAGLLLMQHGLQKLFGMFGAERVEQLASLQGLGGMLETFGGFLVVVGLFTRPVAFVLSGEMAVAYFKFHAARGFFPIVNKGELSALLCFVFLYIAATGAGPYSMDALFRGRRATPRVPSAA